MKKLFLIGTLFLFISGIATAIGEENKNRIAIIGEDYNVYSYDVKNEVLQALTDDGNLTHRYQWPTWSNDGRLAYFCCDLSVTNSLSAQAFISADGIQSGSLVYEAEAETIIYAYWSPESCGENCRDIALLVNDLDEGGIGLELLRDSDEPSSERISMGAPFYYHWDSSGTNMVFHRNNSRIEIYNRGENDISDTYRDLSIGRFQVPAWSPIDDRILIATEGSSQGLTNLTILENGETRSLVEDISGFVSFLWSPDGRYVAYRSYDMTGIGTLIVIDAETGESIATANLEAVIAFFWSPDSSKLAYLTLAPDRSGDAHSQSQFMKLNLVQNDSPPPLLWSILELETGENLRYSSFAPTYEQGYLLIYFEQFAPSHHLWSPDSRYLVYSSFDSNNQPSIITLDSQNGDTNTIGTGVFAVWSFN